MRTRSRLLAAWALATAAANLAVAQSPPAIPIAPPIDLPTVPIVAPIHRLQAPPKPAETRPADKPADKKPAEASNPMAPAVPPDSLPIAQPGSLPAAMTPPAACDTCAQPAEPPPYRVPPHRGPAERGWVRATTSLYFFKPHSLPFAVAVGNRPGQPARTLIGSDNVNVQDVSGIAVDGGLWLSADHTMGVGLGGFLMEQKLRTETATGSIASGVGISRPYTDALTGDPATLLVSAPGTLNTPRLAEGTIVSNVSSRLSGADANLRRNLASCDGYSVDLFYGFRYLDLDESLTIFQSTRPLADGVLRLAGQPVAAGQTVLVTDRVKTRNQFYGGEVGGRFEGRSGALFLAVTPRVGFGPNHQVTEIDGSTRNLTTGQTAPGGLLAVGRPPAPNQVADGNIGRHTVSRFALLMDVGAQVGVQLTQSVRVAAGYNFLYLNNVVRPGEQLQPVVNSRLVPLSDSFGTLSGSRAPQLSQDRDQFYAHGATLSLEFLY